MKDYNKSYIPLARYLRRHMTPQERKLWYDFLRHYPQRFQRQKVIGSYIVDFYCSSAKLAIELDGSGHSTFAQMDKDRFRSLIIQKYGITVIRFSNNDVDRYFSLICEEIDRSVQEAISKNRK